MRTKHLPRLGAIAVMALIGAACEYDISAVPADRPEFSQCDGVTATHGFGYLPQLDDPSGSSHVATDGDDIILITSGPVVVDAGAGDDTICITSAVNHPANAQVTVIGGDGNDTIIAEDGAALDTSCDAETTTGCNTDPTCTTSFTVQGGLEDDYGDPDEPSAPSQNLADYVAANYAFSYIRQFDEELDDRFFAHTFTGLTAPAGEVICDAELRFGATLQDSNDQVLVSVIGDDLQLGPTWDSGLAALGFTSGTPGVSVPQTATLDLSDLTMLSPTQTTNLIPLIQQEGILDMFVQDDSAVDFADLTIFTKPDIDTDGDGLVDSLDPHPTEVDISCDVGQQIQPAIDAASPGDTLWVTGTCTDAIVVPIDLTINGDSATILDPQATVAIQVDNGATVTIDGLDAERTLQPIPPAGTLGVKVEDGGDLTLRNVEIRGHQRGLYVADFTGNFPDTRLDVAGCVVEDNGGADKGGGVAAWENASLVMDDCIIQNNFSTNFGGGLFLRGDATITNTQVLGNDAVEGGGLFRWTSVGVIDISDSAFDGNTASDRGAGVYANLGTSTLNNVTITNNVATNTGGAVFEKSGGQFDMDAATIASITDPASGNSTPMCTSWRSLPC